MGLCSRDLHRHCVVCCTLAQTRCAQYPILSGLQRRLLNWPCCVSKHGGNLPTGTPVKLYRQVNSPPLSHKRDGHSTRPIIVRRQRTSLSKLLIHVPSFPIVQQRRRFTGLNIQLIMTMTRYLVWALTLAIACASTTAATAKTGGRYDHRSR